MSRVRPRGNQRRNCPSLDLHIYRKEECPDGLDMPALWAWFVAVDDGLRVRATTNRVYRFGSAHD